MRTMLFLFINKYIKGFTDLTYSLIISSSIVFIVCFLYFQKYAMSLRELNYKTWLSKIHIICMTLSVFALAITFAVYLLIEKLRNLHGKILLGYVISLLISISFYLLLQVFSITEGRLCIVSGFIIQFTFLSGFFWLNVMCYDVWSTFNRRGYFDKRYKKNDGKKFINYCLYSWGCSSLITSITLIIDNVDVPDTLKPKFGEAGCWYKDFATEFYYYYSFPLAILIINSAMFIHTAMIIIKHGNEVRFLEQQDNKIHCENEKERFYVYLKLFFVMGLSWFINVLPEIILYKYYDEEIIVWDILDIYHSLKGILIFRIFVCNPKVIDSLKETISSQP